MDLNDHAEQAARFVLAEAGIADPDEIAVIRLKRAWYDGYTTGLQAVESMTRAHFEQLQAELS